MDEFKPDYDKWLRSKPFRRTNFTEEQMDRVVAMAEQRQRTGKGRGRAWLRYAAACTAMAAFVFVVLFASGIVPTSLMRTAVGPSGTAENPAGNVYDPLKLNIGDKVASMTAAEVDVSRQGDSVVANILFESEALEISGSYAVVSAASDGDAEGGGLMVAFDPDVQSIGLFPSHNLFAHDIRLILTDAADIRQFGSIGQSGEAVIKIKGYRDRMVGKDDVVQNTTLVEVVSKTPLTGELEPPQDLPDASYSDFAIPASLLMPLRNLEDALTNPDAVYRLHEYQVTGSLENVEKWLRDETKRVGGT